MPPTACRLKSHPRTGGRPFRAQRHTLLLILGMTNISSITDNIKLTGRDRPNHNSQPTICAHSGWFQGRRTGTLPRSHPTPPLLFPRDGERTRMQLPSEPVHGADSEIQVLESMVGFFFSQRARGISPGSICANQREFFPSTYFLNLYLNLFLKRTPECNRSIWTLIKMSLFKVPSPSCSSMNTVARFSFAVHLVPD